VDDIEQMALTTGELHIQETLDVVGRYARRRGMHEKYREWNKWGENRSISGKEMEEVETFSF